MINLKDLTYSDTAIKHNIENIPNQEVIENLQVLFDNIIIPLHLKFRGNIFCTSGYRSRALNKILKGASNSQHCKGEAVDLKHTSGDNKAIFDYLLTLSFDQLIWEFGNDQQPAWVHVSYVKGMNRNQVLKAIKVSGITRYVSYFNK